MIRIGDILYYAHRLVWIMHHGPIADGLVIDHINGDRADNIMSNLRLVTRRENQFNQRVKGYCWDKHRSLWAAKIKVYGKTYNLGRFKTEGEARNAYLQAKKIYHPIKKR